MNYVIFVCASNTSSTRRMEHNIQSLKVKCKHSFLTLKQIIVQATYWHQTRKNKV